MAELEARVEALGRRALFAAASLTVDDLVLDRLAREVRRGGVLVELQPREFQILELLMLNSPVVVTRRMLLEKVFRFRFDPGTNLVESHVSRLRSKIDRGGDAPLIHTVRGEGYAARAD
jgi:two-component system OmpR family response regulator